MQERYKEDDDFYIVKLFCRIDEFAEWIMNRDPKEYVVLGSEKAIQSIKQRISNSEGSKEGKQWQKK